MGAKKTVFLVDDDPVNLMAGSNVLSAAYGVFTFDSGARLFKMLERLLPDLILLDIEMPEMSGYEVIRLLKIRENTCLIPVVFLTAHSDTESELKGLTWGAADYISKPFSPLLLLRRVETHLLVESQKQELARCRAELEKMAGAAGGSAGRFSQEAR